MKNKTLILHHSADFDGLFSGAIARRALPEATSIGWDYGDDVPDVSGFSQIVMLDICIPELMTFPDLVWIDHHLSAIEQYSLNIPGYRINGVAACRLAWQYFFGVGNSATISDYRKRMVSEPLAVALVGEYDVFDKWDSNAELFQHGLKTINLDEHWEALLTEEGFEIPTIAKLLDNGRLIQFVRDNEYRSVIKQQGFTVDYMSVRFLACNSHKLDIRSQLFEGAVKPEHQALLGFTYTGTEWRVSMYHIPGREDIDILSIAGVMGKLIDDRTGKPFGGGGHPGACSFRTDYLPFL